MLWATNEDQDGYDVRFRSSEYSDVNYRPYLSVNYSLEMKKFYYIKDNLDSTRSVINENGNIVESYDYAKGIPFRLSLWV